MRKDEAKCAHVRLDQRSTRKLKKIVRKSKRSLAREADKAVEQYRYRDNGR